MAADIEHVVVLMLENRSFDNMLGKLYPADSTFEGLTGNETNIHNGQLVPVWKSGQVDKSVATIPDPDPGELFPYMNHQLFGAQVPAGPATMGGFVDNYMALPKLPPDGLVQRLERFAATYLAPFVPKIVYDPATPMHYYTPQQVPVISALAKAFGVCDQWFASAPCQTWPNRFFAHTATSLGYANNDDFPYTFTAPSIFSLLRAAKKTWRVYFHDIPQSLLLADVRPDARLHYRFFKQFLADAQTGALPNYSFIEPRYFTDLIVREIPNDEHPPHNVQFGEKLIAQVYNAVRSSPCWKKTLLIITYDEHGGCFDHVVPPPAPIPGPDMTANNRFGFTFNRYGVRVPAVIVSPYIPAGSKIRAVPQGVPPAGPPYPFDHTSIIATVRSLFGLGGPLTGRDGAAPTLLPALSLALPINDGPSRIVAAEPDVSTKDATQRAVAPPNGMQASLARMAASLPARPGAEPAAQANSEHGTVATALAAAKNNVADFLNI